MRTLLHRFFQEKEEWIFQKADLSESRKALVNPSRGWYRIYTFCAEKMPDFQPMLWCDAEGDTLVMVIINIGAYKEKALDVEALENIRTILRFFIKRHYDIILRITYDHEGKALEREPFFFSTVKEHMHQVIPVINEFAEHIFVYQGMLIGNWGEMHTSRFLQPIKLKELWSILKNELDGRIYTAVRRPSCWRMLHPDNDKDNMGLFDDAIFGSENHLGTFGTKSRTTVSWDDLWCKTDEMAFEEELCRIVPNGGEAICGEQYLSAENPGNTVETLRKMHITYLNKEYDKKLLGIWKEWKWEGTDVWNGCSLYDYIGSHLGYRFLVKDAEIVAYDKNTGELKLEISAENVGFAPFYGEAEVVLEQVLSGEKGNTFVLNTDVRKWINGTVQKMISCIPALEGKIYLYAGNKKDSGNLSFANRLDKENRVFLGEIIHNSEIMI